MYRAQFPDAVSRDPLAPIRLLTLTTLFPNSVQPRHGIFVANRLRRLCDTERIEATVVAAVPWFPGAYRQGASIPRVDAAHGFAVQHPRYLNVPGIGMSTQPQLLARALLAELRRNDWDARRFDVVDAHYFYPDGVAAAHVADRLGLPLVVTARGSDINLIGGIGFARRRMLRAAGRAQAMIAVSNALRSRMTDLGMPAERIAVLRNGVDTQVFSPVPRAEARERLRIDKRAACVLGVGNLVPEKGFDLLIRALADWPAARLLIIGEGSQRSSLGALADAVMPGRVEFRGNMPQDELRFAYAAADVLALPSLREGWPNVLLEAMACGTPVVAARVGGVPEIVGPHGPGRVLDDRNPQAWMQALRTSCEAPQDPEQVRRYAALFGWDEVVDRQCALYEEVVRGRAASKLAGRPVLKTPGATGQPVAAPRRNA
jgi:glycosyltransferase involved in cell wall biosynthesis